LRFEEEEEEVVKGREDWVAAKVELEDDGEGQDSKKETAPANLFIYPSVESLTTVRGTRSARRGAFLGPGATHRFAVAG
jgi:hypothetical protein